MQQLSFDFEPAVKMTFTLSLDSIDTVIFPIGKYPPSDIRNQTYTVGEMEDVDDFGEDVDAKSLNNFDEQSGYLNVCEDCRLRIKHDCVCSHMQGFVMLPQSAVGNSANVLMSALLNPSKSEIETLSTDTEKVELHDILNETEADCLDKCKFAVMEGDIHKEKTAKDNRHDTRASVVKKGGPLQLADTSDDSGIVCT